MNQSIGIRAPVLAGILCLAIQQPVADSAVSRPPAKAYHRKGPRVLYGQASWYSEKSPGIRKKTANNEIFNDKKLTAAMWDVAFNQKVKVTNLDNGKAVIVRVNDRGPHRRYYKKGRIIDLTKVAFARLEHPKKGLVSVEMLKD